MERVLRYSSTRLAAGGSKRRRAPHDLLQRLLSSTITTTTQNQKEHELEKEVAYRLPLRCSTRDVSEDWDVDLSNAGLVGAGAFAEVRLARPAASRTLNLRPSDDDDDDDDENQNPSTTTTTTSPTTVVVKSFHQDTDIYFDSLNRELAALDALEHVPGVQNYIMTYGNTFASMLPEGGKKEQETETENERASREEEGAKGGMSSTGELHIVSTFIPHGDLFDYIMNQPNGQVEELNALNIGKQLGDALCGKEKKYFKEKKYLFDIIYFFYLFFFFFKIYFDSLDTF